MTGVRLGPYTTLGAGGLAEQFVVAHTLDEFAGAVARAQRGGTPLTVLGAGSNVLPADEGVPGVTVLNACRRIRVEPGGAVEAETGCAFQELFLKTAQAGLEGLSFAVGIPGTLGGAIVSNAGAYRGNIADFITELEVVASGERAWVPPETMGFSYRDSILRGPTPPPLVVLRVRLRIPPGDRARAFADAAEYQRQRIAKQPAGASAGSFFKNVLDAALAARLPSLPERLREAGVVPAGYLIEQAGLCGEHVGGAVVSMRHANFLINVGGATSTELRRLAERVKSRVKSEFGVVLEEEVLYLGAWPHDFQ